jgi:hypothetical protein
MQTVTQKFATGKLADVYTWMLCWLETPTVMQTTIKKIATSYLEG